MNVVDSNKRLLVLPGACVMLGFLIPGFFGLITGWSYERRQAPVLQPVPAK